MLTLRIPYVLATAIAAATPSVQALDWQVHGSLAQGYVLSEGNNYYGPSRNGGSPQFYEAAVNGTIKPLPQLLFSGQVLARDAGATDDGKPRLDYAFADYDFLSGRGVDAGVRLGRVKNAFGLYNDARDVVSTRPGVIMPSTYFEASGARALLFSSDGVQPYAGLELGDHYLAAQFTYAPNKTLSSAETKRMNLQGDTRLRNFYFARLADEWNRWTTAVSYLHGNMEFEFPPGARNELGFQVYMLSGRYNAETFSVSSEYQLTDFHGTFGGGQLKSKSDGAYLQGDYFLTPQWSLMARWDSSFSDRNDRRGTDPASTCSANFSTGTIDRHNCFAHDLVLGGSWKSAVHWGVWGEYHLIDGLATTDSRDNTPPAPNDPHWSMFLLMAAFRF